MQRKREAVSNAFTVHQSIMISLPKSVLEVGLTLFLSLCTKTFKRREDRTG
jgi:hypothetical protein